ncbi:unnamed protein product [Phytophthora lilii]|uniref:Unnamed protein product n=1 Tax=Phytophthora lilii TaxID=2077276 RepID=A0A9W6U773_9STRA|nr:unnamed protein product [Phytophthora lilii]
MDTDSGYIAFSHETPFPDLIKPELLEHYEQHKYEWFPRNDTTENAAFDRRTPGLFKEEFRCNAMGSPILTAININSRLGFAELLKNKRADTVLSRIKAFVKEEKVEVLTTDNGKEFLNRKATTYLKSQNITHYNNEPGDHATMAINSTPIQAKGKVMEGDLNHNRELMERLENELPIGATVLYRLDKGAFDKEKARWSNTVYEIVGIDGYRVQIRLRNRHTIYKAPNDIKLFKSKATDAKVGKNQVFEAEELLDHKKMKNGKLKYLVNWIGYDDPTWEPQDNLRLINKSKRSTLENDLAQREQKQQELLERAQRRVRQATAKREMYAGAQWSSDVSNAITTVPKKTTESAQTDISVAPDAETPDELKIPLSEILKKSLEDENSQAYPDLSPPEVETQTTGTDATSATIDEEANDQEESKNALIKLFEVYPVLSKMKLHPLDSEGRQLTKYFLGVEAKIYNNNGNQVSVRRINWYETYSSIGDIIKFDTRFLQYIVNRKKQRSIMFKEYQEAEPVEVCKTLIGNKRRLSNPSVYDNSNRSKQRLDDSFLIDSSTSTENDVLNEGKVMDVKQYTEPEGDVEAKQGVLSNTDEYMGRNLTPADNHAKEILADYFNMLRIKKI